MLAETKAISKSIIIIFIFYCVALICPGYVWARGEPRVQYARTYWVIHDTGNLNEWQVRDIAGQAFDDGKRTLGYSFDDAGIGDLNVRNVVVWGWPQNDVNTLLNWYKTYYGGVTVSFRSLPGQGSYSYGPYYTTAPATGRGTPREDYPREYWVLDGDVAIRDQFIDLAVEAFGNSRQTVGFSFDDAGIGDLNTRKIVVKEIGNYTREQLVNFYSTYYPGVNVSFVDTEPEPLEQNGLAINIGWPATFPTTQQISGLSPDIVRTIVYARDYQNGRYTTLDDAIDRYQGLSKICVVINHEGLNATKPAWDAPLSQWQNYITQFSEHVKHLARVYNGQVYAWEIWNEQDDIYEPYRGMTANVYAVLLDETLRKIKTVSSASVISGGLYTGNLNYLRDFKNRMSYYHLLDGVGYHPYVKRADGYPSGSYGPWTGELRAFLNSVYAVAQKPIWVTEFGAPFELFNPANGNQPTQQGEYLRRAYDVFKSMGKTKIATAMWFAWDDRTHWKPNEEHFGLVDQSHNPRPAWSRFANLLTTYDWGFVGIAPFDPCRVNDRLNGGDRMNSIGQPCLMDY